MKKENFMKKMILGLCVLGCVAIAGQVLAANDTVVVGKLVKVDYTLTVNKEVIETSSGKAPMQYVAGSNSIIPGLEKALMGMHVGEEKIVNLAPADAYGMSDEKAVKEFPKTSMPKGVELKKGMILQANAPDGTSFPATIKEVKDTTVVLDFNHPLAGKQLEFKVKVVGVEEAPKK